MFHSNREIDTGFVIPRVLYLNIVFSTKNIFSELLLQVLPYTAKIPFIGGAGLQKILPHHTKVIARNNYPFRKT